MILPFGNEFVSGGIILIILGAALAYFRNLPRKVYSVFERYFIIRIDIQEEDESFAWLKLWLAKQLEGTLSVSVLSRRPQLAPEWTEEPKELLKYMTEEASSSDRRPRVVFTPAPGWYWFFYQGKLVTVSRDRTNPEAKGDSIAKPHESFTMRVFARDLSIAKRLIEEARDFALPKDGKLEVRTCGQGHYWALTGRIRPRPLESVILDDNKAEILLNDVKKFQRDAEWYTNKGVPYRRGYLLYGSPGSGKSSLALAIASELGMNINILNLSTPGLSDAKIIELLAAVDVNTIILIEDIDCAFVKRHSGPDRKDKLDFGLTFSGLLNALDGILAQDGRIVFMTTNYPERLDAALVREGRVDVKIHIDNATRDQIKRLFLRFYPDVPIGMAEQFASKLPDREIKMAKLQGHFMKYRDDPKRALSYCEEITKKEEYERSRRDSRDELRIPNATTAETQTPENTL